VVGQIHLATVFCLLLICGVKTTYEDFEKVFEMGFLQPSFTQFIWIGYWLINSDTLVLDLVFEIGRD
jgi:ABC-type multidrug transport system permease subunit